MNLPLLLIAIAIAFYIFSISCTILLNAVKELLLETNKKGENK